MTLLARVVAHLENRKIRFALIGATAMAAHGVARSTLGFDRLTTDPRALDAGSWSLADATVDLRRGNSVDPLAAVDERVSALPSYAVSLWERLRSQGSS